MQHLLKMLTYISLASAAMISGYVHAEDNSFKDTLALQQLGLASNVQSYQADASKGETLANQRCIACHGDAMLKMMTTYPNLKGQKGAYLFKQLVQFKRGDRVNPIMQAQAGMLSETQMKDVALYYSQQSAVDLSQ